MKKNITRRRFVSTSVLAGASLGFLNTARSQESTSARPAILGGAKAHDGSFPSWPIFDETEEAALSGVLKSARWGRLIGNRVVSFEEAFQKLTGAKHCIATSSGTTALVTSLGALGIGPGDEVLLTPYTFIATYNAIVLHYALPVFVDVDRDSFQMDAGKVAEKITTDTKAILPVHIGGSMPEMDVVMEHANKHKIPVIEDACQAHLSEWRGHSVGLSGLAGCFSFQASKNLTAGEGGMIVTNDNEFAARCYNFQNHGQGRAVAGKSFTGERGANFRMTEFQGGILLAQLTRLAAQSQKRDENAALLDKMLAEISGIQPSRPPKGCTRRSHHLYMFRYNPDAFAGLSRAKFVAALSKEGFPCSTGYIPLHVNPYVQALAQNPHYLKIYGKEKMSSWLKQNQCPVTDRLAQEALWFTQTTLLGSKREMEQIAEAIRKIQKNAAEISRK